MADLAGGGRTRGAAPVGVGINIPGLHYWMWLRRDVRTTMVRVDPKRLSKMLGCGDSTIPRLVAKLVDEKRIIEIQGDQLPWPQRGIVLADPDQFCTCGAAGCPAAVTPQA